MSSNKILSVLLVAMMAMSVVIIAGSDDSHADDTILEDGMTWEIYTFSPKFSTQNVTNVDYMVWDFGDGTNIDFSDADSEDPDVKAAFEMQILEHGGNPDALIHTYEDVGTYILTVTAYKEGMEPTQKTITVIVKGHPTITFVSEGSVYGKLEVPKEGDDGGYAPNVADPDMIPADPEKEGYTFSGWYTEDGQLFDFTEPVSEHVTLTAQFVEGEDVVLHNVTFAGGEASAQKVSDGQTAQKPVDPVKIGFDFGGWYTDAECTQPYDWNTPVTHDVVLYAKWTEHVVEPEKHTISFIGANVQAMLVEDGETAVLPSNPFKAGYKFEGWYTDAECTQPYDWNTPVTHDVILYAKWTELTVGDDGIGVVSIAAAIIGLVITAFAYRDGSRSMVVIGFIILLIGCLSIYADYIGSDILTMLKDLIGGGEDA